MKKKFLKVALTIVIAITGCYSGYKAYNIFTIKNTTENDLFLANVEALSMSEVINPSDRGLVVYTFCSKKKGSVYCSLKRGKRKWAHAVKIMFGNTITCPECPDTDYDYEDDI